jgi:hypothetical protein
MGLRFDYFHTSTLPRLHSIVWCRIPENDGSPGANVRPALVRASKRDRVANRGAVWVSYGTANLQYNDRIAVDLIIQNFERLGELELPQAVRFDLDRFNWLPWCSEFFCPPAHSDYMVAGMLSSTEIAALRSKLKHRGIITEL